VHIVEKKNTLFLKEEVYFYCDGSSVFENMTDGTQGAEDDHESPRSGTSPTS
jgi:hypothetical protein